MVTFRKSIILIITVSLLIASGLTSKYLLELYKATKKTQRMENLQHSPLSGKQRPDWSPIITSRPNANPIKIGHRGASNYAPENTLASIQTAIELGIDYVEIDVRYTSDGVPILFHDKLLHRTTDGVGLVKNKSLAELQKLDAGSWFDEEFKGTQVPTLKDALALIKGNACLLWHIKSTVKPKAIELIRKFSPDGDCLLISMPVLIGVINPEDPLATRGVLNPEDLAVFAEHWPDAPMLPSIGQAGDIPRLLEQYPSAVAVMVRPGMATVDVIDAAHKVGLLVIVRLPEQLDNAEHYKKVLDAGVDGIFMDNFDLLDAYLNNQPQNFNAMPED